ncbi:MAG: hypothetical protein LRS48_06360 [Desulfurococcales archaeon]|nr:hypothetical protein [Desulfurococcales archaeon]
MSGNCRIAGRPIRFTIVFIAASITAAVAGLLVLRASRAPGPVLAGYSIVSALVVAASSVLVASKSGRQSRALRVLCGLCGGEPEYCPLRFTYSCRLPGGVYACYSSVEDRYYIVRVDDVLEEEPLSLWNVPEPYCARPLRGARTASGVFEGEILVVDCPAGKLIRARGSMTVPSTDNISEALESMLGRRKLEA